MHHSNDSDLLDRYGALPWLAGAAIALVIAALMFGLSAGYW